MLKEKIEAARDRCDHYNDDFLAIQVRGLRDLLEDYGQNNDEILDSLIKYLTYVSKKDPRLGGEALNGETDEEILSDLIAYANKMRQLFGSESDEGMMWQNVYAAIRSLV